MKETRILMGMPVTVEVIGSGPVIQKAIEEVFGYFAYVDQTFSTFKETSEITHINRGLLKPSQYSSDMQEVLALSEKTKQETNGYFDIVTNQETYDPSGLVKGWAINKATSILDNRGFANFYVEAGGDIQVRGHNEEQQPWLVGIKNPFNVKEIVKVVHLAHNEGIATSGSYERGNHIYNPKNRTESLACIVSITVIGANVYEADRFATAAFAMQEQGIHFIEQLPSLEGYAIDTKGMATMTTGFKKYL